MCSELRDTTASKHYYFFPENHIVKLPKKKVTMPINQSLQICAGIANYWCKSDGSSRYDMGDITKIFYDTITIRFNTGVYRSIYW